MILTTNIFFCEVRSPKNHYKCSIDKTCIDISLQLQFFFFFFDYPCYILCLNNNDTCERGKTCSNGLNDNRG